MKKKLINIAGIELKNPVMVASGTFGYGKEFAEFVDLNKLGAIITKTISLKPKAGNPPPRMCETTAGMLNSIGLQNDGIDQFIDKQLQFLAKLKIPAIVNIAGDTPEEFAELARILSKEKTVKGLELNVSCPNVKKGGMLFGCSESGLEEVVRATKKKSKVPVIVKLSPNVTDIASLALIAEKSGADAISLINTLLGIAVDVRKKEFKLSTKTGGLSGPAIKPVALRMVWQVAKQVKIPVIGIGGITTAEDVLEFLMVGATAVQVGTVNFRNTSATAEIIKDLAQYDLGEYQSILQNS